VKAGGLEKKRQKINKKIRGAFTAGFLSPH